MVLSQGRSRKSLANLWIGSANISFNGDRTIINLSTNANRHAKNAK